MQALLKLMAMQQVGIQARRSVSCFLVSASSTFEKSCLVCRIYTALENNQAQILAANQIDMENGRRLAPTGQCPA